MAEISRIDYLFYHIVFGNVYVVKEILENWPPSLDGLLASKIASCYDVINVANIHRKEDCEYSKMLDVLKEFKFQLARKFNEKRK
jgi:hypothetical protein